MTEKKKVVKRTLSPEEKAQRQKVKKINNTFIMLILAASLITTVLLSINIVRIGFKKTASTGGETLQLSGGKVQKNDYYKIGNNPTSVQKDYFKELTDSLSDTSEEGKKATAEALVKCFVADYFTWTNKDGNYEVGGTQYVFGPKYVMFQEQSRYQFYADLDLYITQYGRENLLEVSSVEVSEASEAAPETINEESYNSYYVEARWEYKDSSKIDVSEFQNKAYFVIVDNAGRLEVAQMQPLA